MGVPISDLVDPDAVARLRALAGEQQEAEVKNDPVGMEHKSDPLGGATQVLEADEATGQVRAVVSVTGVEDRVKDIIEPGAYTKSIAKQEPIGVWSHDDKTWVARADSYRELLPGDPEIKALGLKLADGSPWPANAGAVIVDARFNLETPHGAAAFSDVKFFQGKTSWSIGYKATKAHRNPRTGIRHIKELDWYEFSPVMVGANQHAMTLSVKSLAEGVDPDDDTGLVDAELLESLSEDELAAYDELKADLGLEEKGVRRVRSAAGAARYGVPIGTIIRADGTPISSGAGGDGGRARARTQARGRSIELPPKKASVARPPALKPDADRTTKARHSRAMADAAEKMVPKGSKLKVGGTEYRVQGVTPVEVANAYNNPKGDKVTIRLDRLGKDGSAISSTRTTVTLDGLEDLIKDTRGGDAKPDPRAPVGKPVTGEGPPRDARPSPAKIEAAQMKAQAHTMGFDPDRGAANFKLESDPDGKWKIRTVQANGNMGGDSRRFDSKAEAEAAMRGDLELSMRSARPPKGDEAQLRKRFNDLWKRHGDKKVRSDLTDAGDSYMEKAEIAELRGFFAGRGDDDEAPIGFKFRKELEASKASPDDIAKERAERAAKRPKPSSGSKLDAALSGGPTDSPNAPDDASGPGQRGKRGAKINMEEVEVGDEVELSDGTRVKVEDIDKFDGGGGDIVYLEGGKRRWIGAEDVYEVVVDTDFSGMRKLGETDAEFVKRREASGKPLPADHPARKGGTDADKRAKANRGPDTRDRPDGTGTADETPNERARRLARESGAPMKRPSAAARRRALSPDARDARAAARATQAPQMKPRTPDADDDQGPRLNPQKGARRQSVPEATDEDTVIEERRKLAAINKRRRAQGKPPLLRLPNSAKSLDLAETTDDELDLAFADDPTVEVKGSRASLDRSPRKNWVEKSGDLPGYVREVARAIEKTGKPLSTAIPMAISRIKRWARGGDGVNADTVAKALKAVAEWEALKAKNRMKFDSELLDHLEQKALAAMPDEIQVQHALDVIERAGFDVKAIVGDDDDDLYELDPDDASVLYDDIDDDEDEDEDEVDPDEIKAMLAHGEALRAELEMKNLLEQGETFRSELPPFS